MFKGLTVYVKHGIMWYMRFNMKKFVICFMFCFCNIFVLINGANASNLKEYDSLNRLDQYRRAFGVQSNMAQQYADDQAARYRVQMGNQMGVPYEVYVCQGNWQCLQQFELQRQQNQALQNQRIRIDANVNYRYNNNRYRY